MNLSKLDQSLGVTHPTIKRYLDISEQTYMVRSLPPYNANLNKRLGKSAKITSGIPECFTLCLK